MNDQHILQLIAGRDQQGLEQMERKYRTFALRTASRFRSRQEGSPLFPAGPCFFFGRAGAFAGS